MGRDPVGQPPEAIAVILPPQPGQAAPEFGLANQYGEECRLTDLRGRAVVLVFYPFAFSAVCTRELEELQAHHSEFSARGAVVLGVSVDHRYTLRSFALARAIDFTLLADFWPHGAVAQRYGAFNGESGHAGRYTFIIDAGGRVAEVIHSAHGQARSTRAYLDSLGTLQAGDHPR